MLSAYRTLLFQIDVNTIIHYSCCNHRTKLWVCTIAIFSIIFAQNDRIKTEWLKFVDKMRQTIDKGNLAKILDDWRNLLSFPWVVNQLRIMHINRIISSCDDRNNLGNTNPPFCIFTSNYLVFFLLKLMYVILNRISLPR